MQYINAFVPAVSVTVFFAILFLQSGLDKVFQYKNNLEYLKEHFSASPLARQVGIMLPVITFLEVLTGLVSVAAALEMLFWGTGKLTIYSPTLASLSLLCLFFGQRMAKDYAGAAGIVPYFLVALFGLIVCAF